MEVIIVNIIGWGLIYLLFSNSKVTIDEVKHAYTQDKLEKLQKKIKRNGLQKIEEGLDYIVISVEDTCDHCNGNGMLFPNSVMGAQICPNALKKMDGSMELANNCTGFEYIKMVI